MGPARPNAENQNLLEVVVGASPAGPNLFPEVRLVKPAILYADRTRLLSPMATFLGGIAAMSTAEGAERRRDQSGCPPSAEGLGYRRLGR
jgi:hypothetical protein